jgi:phosphonoacetate hydrolase
MSSITVNDRCYRVPDRPVVVITVDGGDPRYFRNGLDRGLLPRLAKMLDGGGSFRTGAAEMPSLTNPNNMSIVTGVSPALHGIPGNYCRMPDGSLQLLNDPQYLRAPSIHSAFIAHGVPALAVTTKDKLRRLLGHGSVPSISVECAAGAGISEFGIADVSSLVGGPIPDIYDPLASHYALRMGLAVVERAPDLRLLYVSLTDRVQHAAGPGTELADEFFAGFDSLLGDYLDAGCTVAITADHGMNAKHNSAGDPQVLYLGQILAQAEIGPADVVLPITDPYTRHHSSLGGFAWLYLEPRDIERAEKVLAAVPGIEEILRREVAATLYELPADRIGDLGVAAGATTALGNTPAHHDLSLLHGNLRSHGSRHEQWVPLIVSSPVQGPLARRFDSGIARNRDIHDLALNHIAG